jgi:prophage regulatory protein
MMHNQVARLLRRFEVESLCGLSRSGIYAAMAEGRFPRPVRIGGRGVRWREAEILAWIGSRPSAGAAP